MNRKVIFGICVAVLSASCSKPGAASNAPSDVTAAPTAVPAASTGSPAVVPLANRTEQAGRDSEGHTVDTSLASIIGALKHDLVGSGSIDGQPITDVQRQSRCETAFVTARGRTVIHWSGVGNFAAHAEAGTVTIPINDGGGEHKMVLPDGDTSRGVDGAFGLLADQCEKTS